MDKKQEQTRKCSRVVELSEHGCGKSNQTTRKCLACAVAPRAHAHAHARNRDGPTFTKIAAINTSTVTSHVPSLVRLRLRMYPSTFFGIFVLLLGALCSLLCWVDWLFVSFRLVFRPDTKIRELCTPDKMNSPTRKSKHTAASPAASRSSYTHHTTH